MSSWTFWPFVFKAWCFSFHVSGFSCSGHFDYFESLRRITFFLTQQLQIAEKSFFPLLPMKMLWIAGKRRLSCNNWRAFQSWLLSLSSFSPHKMIWHSCPEMKLLCFEILKKSDPQKKGLTHTGKVHISHLITVTKGGGVLFSIQLTF